MKAKISIIFKTLRKFLDFINGVISSHSVSKGNIFD